MRSCRNPVARGELDMSWNDSEYFRGRAEAERASAAKAANPFAAEIHLELAERYERLVSEGRRPSLRLASVQEALTQ